MARTEPHVTRNKPWLCARCGYMMDAVSPIFSKSKRVPKERDLSLCLNCGAAYSLCRGNWVALTAAERAELPAKLRSQILQAEMARSMAITTDLSRRDRESDHGPH